MGLLNLATGCLFVLSLVSDPFSSVYTCSREHLFLVPWKILLQRDDGRLAMESLKRSQCSQLLYLVFAQFVSQSVLLSLSDLVFGLNSLPRP